VIVLRIIGRRRGGTVHGTWRVAVGNDGGPAGVISCTDDGLIGRLLADIAVAISHKLPMNGESSLGVVKTSGRSSCLSPYGRCSRILRCGGHCTDDHGQNGQTGGPGGRGVSTVTVNVVWSSNGQRIVAVTFTEVVTPVLNASAGEAD